MQCQSGILKDSLTFLPGDLKKIKVYNIFRVLYFRVTPQMVCQDGECPCLPVSREDMEEGTMGCFLFVFNPPF